MLDSRPKGSRRCSRDCACRHILADGKLELDTNKLDAMRFDTTDNECARHETPEDIAPRASRARGSDHQAGATWGRQSAREAEVGAVPAISAHMEKRL